MRVKNVSSVFPKVNPEPSGEGTLIRREDLKVKPWPLAEIKNKDILMDCIMIAYDTLDRENFKQFIDKIKYRL